MPIDTPIHTNEQSIERVLSAGAPVLLVFWRKGSAACQQLEPVLGRLAKAYAGRALIARIDMADSPALARRFGVAQLPGLVFVRGGQPIAQADGAAPEAALEAWLRYLTEGGARPPLPGGPSEPLAGRAAPVPASAPTNPPASGNRAAQPIALTDANFDRIIGTSDKPVLVDFWAAWCGPCRAVAPTVERMAEEFAGRAVVAKLNVDENPHTARRFGISGIPALYIFRRGQVVERLVGAQPASALRQALARHTAA